MNPLLSLELRSDTAAKNENGDLIKKKKLFLPLSLFLFPRKNTNFLLPLFPFSPPGLCRANSSLCYSFRVATVISPARRTSLVSVHGLSTRCDRPRDRQVVSVFSRGHPIQGRGLTHEVAAGRRDGTGLAGGRTGEGGFVVVGPLGSSPTRSQTFQLVIAACRLLSRRRWLASEPVPGLSFALPR